MRIKKLVSYAAFPPAGVLRPSTPWPSSEGAGVADGDSHGSYISIVTS